MPSFYALILSAIMPLKKGALYALVAFSALLGIGDADGAWFTWPASGGEKVDADVLNASQEVDSYANDTPPTPYKYPTPSFIEDNVTAMVALMNNNTVIDWIKDHPWIYGVIGGVALISVIVLTAITVCCCCFCCRRRGKCGGRRPPDTTEGGSQKGSKRPQIGTPSDAEERRKQREIEDRGNAVEAVKGFFLANSSEYQTQPDESGNLPDGVRLPDMGSRMQKYWFLIRPIQQLDSLTGKPQPLEYPRLIVTAAPVSQKCPLKLHKYLKGLNKLIGALKLHPYLHKILRIDYRYDTKQVIIVQPYMENGSLKDLIYKASPSTDWSRKYSRRSRGLPVDKIRRYGRQILEAMVFLYSKGFPTLGHVQSGNVFVDAVSDTCLLGGYESTLLGYKTRLYRLCRSHLQYFDVIMFGHLLFEMSCGYELTKLSPEDDEYKSIRDDDIKEILHYVFKDDFSNSIEKIKAHPFFSVELAKPEVDPTTVEIELSDQMKKVLEKVRKSKPHQQLDEAPSPSFIEKLKQKTKRDKEEQPGPGTTTEVTVHSNVSERRGSSSLLDKLHMKVPWKKEKGEAAEKEGLLIASGEANEPEDA